MTGRPVLELRGVGKSFAGVPALDDVSLEVAPGTVHCLVGGNGSGKSTLIKVLAGVSGNDATGEITVDGRSIAAADLSPRWAREAGLRFVHQDIGVFDDMTIAENLAVVTGYPSDATWRIRWDRLHRKTAQLLEQFGIEGDPTAPAGSLRPAARTMLAIARALHDGAALDGPSGAADDAAILVLDEPTASLPVREAEFLLAMLRRYAASGSTIVLVTHHLAEVLEVADDVTVLRDGRRVATQTAASLTHASLAELIVGSAIGERSTRSAGHESASSPSEAEGTDAGLVIERLSGGAVHDISLHLRPGEIVGIAGMRGSGRSQLLRLVAGLAPVSRGTARVNGTDLTGSSFQAVMDAGIAYVPEDRDRDAAFGDMTVQDNLLAPSLPRYLRRGRLDAGRERRDSATLIRRFGVRCRGERQTMSTLSGGNRQKVVIARWMHRDPSVLLLDEPTQGVDIGARLEIHRLIEAAADNGTAALVVSSDFEELCLLCDRIVVMRSGRITHSLDRHQATPTALAALSFASTEHTS